MALDPAVLKARIDLRVCQLKQRRRDCVITAWVEDAYLGELRKHPRRSCKEGAPFIIAVTMLAALVVPVAGSEGALAATLNYHFVDCNKPNSDKPNWAYFHRGAWWLRCRAYKTEKSKHPDTIFVHTEKSPQDVK